MYRDSIIVQIKLGELLRDSKRQETELENLMQERLLSHDICKDLEFNR